MADVYAILLLFVFPEGTDATHAEHIETIKSRMYVGLTPEQRFLPGELGMGLVEGKPWITALLKQNHPEEFDCLQFISSYNSILKSCYPSSLPP